ncbi:hypothetical protein TruAng_004256 [Truncatella angustata]|nr:hypothetical protein TruAng_004256 [Truncatella angustata]
MKPSLTIFEKLNFAFRLPLIILPRLIINCVRCTWLAWRRALPIHLYLRVGIIRTILGCLKPREIQFISPTSVETYESWMSKKTAAARRANDISALDRLKMDIEMLPDGKSSLLWIGNRNKASKYVLFLHGGGYIAPMAPGHLEWCYRAYIENDVPGVEVAVAVLQYTLCPDARHPLQISQANAALGCMLNSGIRPGNIVVGGDSAGANLTAQLLGHLAHGKPQITLSEPLAGAFTVSPWVSTSTTMHSFLENQYIDMLASEIAATSAQALLGESQTPPRSIEDQRGWPMPLDVDGKWLNDWEKVSKALYVTVGSHEVLRDQGVLFAEHVRQRNKVMDVCLHIAETDAHDFVLLEALMVFEAGEKMADMPTPRLDQHRSMVMSFFGRQAS